MEEIFKQIAGYEGKYEVSNFGNIRSTDRTKLCKTGYRKYRGKSLTPGDRGDGYMTVRLGAVNSTYVHRIVAYAFLPNPENKAEVNHINGLRSDNRAENLCWVTKSENERHARGVLGKKPGGLGLKGWNNHKSIPINQLDIKGNFIKIHAGQAAAAESLGLWKTGIHKCLKGRRKSIGGFKFSYA